MDKKKVAIVTIESENYGNRLQNYALQKIVEELEFNVETLSRKEEQNHTDFRKNIIQFIIQSKGYKFKQFQKFIKKSKYYADADTIPAECIDKYVFFITGSDQVWNPHYKFVGKTDLLYGVPYLKSIAYAASFGVNSLPNEQMAKYIEGLKNIKFISVREYEAARIVEDLTGESPQVVLDPTMLLGAETWRKLEKKPRFMVKKNNFVFVYVLGKYTKKMKSVICKYQSKGYQIIDVNDKNLLGRSKSIGPQEFLWLIDNAAYMITDSFHGTVFSILFHKKFHLINRCDELNMSSRLNTLLKAAGIICDNGNIEESILYESIDYENVEKNISKLRKNSLYYLKRALGLLK